MLTSEIVFGVYLARRYLISLAKVHKLLYHNNLNSDYMLNRVNQCNCLE